MEYTTSRVISSHPCPWCSTQYSQIFHSSPCPNVEEIEFFENGTLKRIKFRNPSYRTVTINPNPYVPYTNVTRSSNGNSGQSTIHPK
jgi:hypothetical protein